jgi:uncharacterized protein YgbK (DUF1537 family)
MIAVIADDFTGAAEIGGIGLRHGLKVVIKTDLVATVACDLLIIATDTRSLSKENAFSEIKKITAYLISLKPQLIFKKIDSVLRGNIEYELVAQMEVMKKSRAIVVAGNPNFYRLIKNGIYYVNNQLLSDTSFATDPEFPAKTSSVLEIIQKGTVALTNCNSNDELPPSGLIIGDSCSEEDLERWANRLEPDSIAAGSAVFFHQVLKKYYPKENISKQSQFTIKEKSLFIFGSKFPKSEYFLKRMNASDMEITNMPEALFESVEMEIATIKNWADEIIKSLTNGKKVAVTMIYNSDKVEGLSNRIKKNISLLVSNILAKTTIDDLLIEGGATTFAILNQLKISELYPVKEIEPGVIQMIPKNHPNLYITTKPGSYLWPDEIWIPNNKLP